MEGQVVFTGTFDNKHQYSYAWIKFYFGATIIFDIYMR